MNNKQVIGVNTQDIGELMSLLTIKFDNDEAMASKMVMLCFVVGELCVKFHGDNWPYKESFNRSIKMMRKVAREIANELYQADKGFNWPEEEEEEEEE